MAYLSHNGIHGITVGLQNHSPLGFGSGKSPGKRNGLVGRPRQINITDPGLRCGDGIQKTASVEGLSGKILTRGQPEAKSLVRLEVSGNIIQAEKAFRGLYRLTLLTGDTVRRNSGNEICCCLKHSFVWQVITRQSENLRDTSAACLNLLALDRLSIRTQARQKAGNPVASYSTARRQAQKGQHVGVDIVSDFCCRNIDIFSRRSLVIVTRKGRLRSRDRLLQKMIRHKHGGRRHARDTSAIRQHRYGPSSRMRGSSASRVRTISAGKFFSRSLNASTL